MIFATKGDIENILSGRKTQTRQLVEYGEHFKAEKVTYALNGKVKWRVGRDYAVQPNKGLPGVWYCPSCKSIYPCVPYIEHLGLEFTECNSRSCLKVDSSDYDLKPLRIVIKSIKKECLLDVSEADAKKEGFENKIKCLDNFYWMNKNWTSADCFIKSLKGKLWNPRVGVIGFEVRK